MRCAIIKAARFASLCLGLAAGACSDDDPPQAQSEGEDEGDDEEEDEGESETGEPSALGDQCADTVLGVEAPTAIAATLRDVASLPAGSTRRYGRSRG